MHPRLAAMSAWCRRGAKVIALIAAIVGSAADLTADLPIALPKWLGWLAPLANIPDGVFHALYVVGAVLFFYFWRTDSQERARATEATSRAVRAEASLVAAEEATAAALARAEQAEGALRAAAELPPSFAEPPLTSEEAGRLAKLHLVADPALQWAGENLFHDLHRDAMDGGSEDRRALVYVVNKLLRPGYEENRARLDESARQKWRDRAKNQVIDQWQEVIKSYRVVCDIAVDVGRPIHGLNYFGTQGYREFHVRHEAFVKDLSELAVTHESLAKIADDLEGLRSMPRPPERTARE